MKNILTRKTKIILAAALLAWGIQADELEPKALDACFSSAVKQSEAVGTQQELIRQAEESYKQAIGSVLPNISGVGSYQWQQNNPAGGFSTLYPSPATSSKLMVTQPIFQGFKEWAGFRQTKALIGASENDKRQAATALYQSVAMSYYLVISYEHDIENVIEELNYYDKRIQELTQFRKIGRAQLTDVLTAQSQQASLRAQLKQDEGLVKAQRAVLSFLTGFDTNVPLARPKGDSVDARALDEYLARVDQRPDVMGDLTRMKAAEEGIPIARAGHLPVVALQGDYYLERTGALKDVSWDALITLTIPIFEGGVIQSQVRSAVSKRDQADLLARQTKRLAIQQIKQFYENYLGDKEQFEAYRVATELSEKNYKEELHSFRLGLVTNLDVLTALTTFMESKRSFDRSHYSMLTDFADLESAGSYVPVLKDLPKSRE